MPYDFTDDPNPKLETVINAVGNVELVNGSPQSELITTAYTGSSVSVTIEPPAGWEMDSVTWTPAGNGTIAVPATGVEETHSFSYTIKDEGGTQSKSGAGVFKIKKNGD